MKRIAWISCLIMSLLLTACLTSVHPLYTEKDRRFDDRLIGAWNQLTFSHVKYDGDTETTTVTFDEEGHWFFSEEEDKDREGPAAYKLLHWDEGETDTAEYEAVLMELGGVSFLDIFPEDVPVNNTLAFMTLFPTHLFAKVELDSDTTRLKFFNGDWLVDLIEENRVRIKHEQSGGEHTLLTAGTEDLQKFVLKYLEEEKAYGDELILIRQ